MMWSEKYIMSASENAMRTKVEGFRSRKISGEKTLMLAEATYSTASCRSIFKDFFAVVTAVVSSPEKSGGADPSYSAFMASRVRSMSSLR